MLSILYNLVKIITIIFLPFILLIRGAVYLYLEEGLSSYFSLAISIVGTALVLVIYFSMIYGRMTKKRGFVKYLRRRFAVSFFIVGAFVLYGVAFLSLDNAKTSEVAQEFRQLHPILRLGCSTLFLLDKKAVITDAARVPEDYRKMGLKTANQSLHYKQKDGYVHAIDFRTKYRWEISNQLLKYYFKMMGFKTLRHVGTADHLHISLPLKR